MITREVAVVLDEAHRSRPPRNKQYVPPGDAEADHRRGRHYKVLRQRARRSHGGALNAAISRRVGLYIFIRNQPAGQYQKRSEWHVIGRAPLGEIFHLAGDGVNISGDGWPSRKK